MPQLQAGSTHSLAYDLMHVKVRLLLSFRESFPFNPFPSDCDSVSTAGSMGDSDTKTFRFHVRPHAAKATPSVITVHR